MKMSEISKIVYLFVSSAFFSMFDLYFSNLIILTMDSIPQNPVLDLVFVQNTGAAFNIFQNSKIFLITFSISAIIAIFAYVVKNIKKYSPMTVFWVSLLVSGIFCNMLDRVIYGYVRDFFKLNFVDFPVFNISDIFINVSVFAIVVIIVLKNYSKNNETDN